MEEVKTVEVQANDIEKLYAFICYICFFGILVYRTKQDNDYIQHHSRQGIVLFALSLANFVLMAVPVLGWFFIPLLNLGLLFLFIVGANNALSGNMKRLPIVGQFANVIK